MSTKYIPITPLNFHSEIRVDTMGDEVSVSVYNCDIKHLDLLIQQLEALKAEHSIEVSISDNGKLFIDNDNIFPDSPKTSMIVSVDDNGRKYIDNREPKDMKEKLFVQADEPAEMTAVLGVKPDPTAWYGKALRKNVDAMKVSGVYSKPVIVQADPEMPKTKFMNGVINVLPVVGKAWKGMPGKIYSNEKADICKGSWIRIYGLSDTRTKWDAETKMHTSYREAFDRTFKMGDVVEYGSYNMKYTGKIVAIGEKTVKVEHSNGGKVTQLSLHDFIWRNWDLDLNKISEDNYNWSMTS